MLKRGDKFRDSKTGKTYMVKAFDHDTVILEIEDGSNQTIRNQNMTKKPIRTMVGDSLIMLSALPSQS